MQAQKAPNLAHRNLRPLYMALGLVFVGLGFVGYVVPGMPGTVFLVMALWAFKRGSPRLEDWLLNRSFAGPTLREWEEDRSIRMRTKILAISVVWISISLSCFVLRNRPSAVWLIPVLLACAIGVTIYLWTRKTRM